MKLVVKLFTILSLLAGGIVLIRLSIDNRDLAKQIGQLEAEVGRMSIDNADQVYFVEIQSPDVPPEVAPHLERVWQFRYYMPPGYDVIRFSGEGRVAIEGVYFAGGFSSGWGTPQPEGTHQLLTVSFQRKDNRWEAFSSFGGSSGTSSWSNFDPDHIDSESLVIQKIVSCEQGSRSFDRDTILPVLRIFDPSSAEDKQVAGDTMKTYNGGLIVLCPKSREQEFRQLRRGETPTGFKPSWVATVVSDE